MLKRKGENTMAKDRTPKEYKIPERPINEIFLSLNGISDGYSFRGINENKTPAFQNKDEKEKES